MTRGEVAMFVFLGFVGFVVPAMLRWMHRVHETWHPDCVWRCEDRHARSGGDPWGVRRG